MGKILRVFSPALLVLVCSTAAHAEPFTILPNGELVFNVALTTNGLFTCGSVVSCTGSGTNSITLESGQGTATFTFTSVSTSFAVGNTTIPVTLGTFTDSRTAGFSVPDLNPNLGLFSFGLTVSHSSPVVASGGLGWQFNSSFSRISEGTYFALPTGPQPPQFHYGPIIYTMRVFPLTLPLDGSRDLVADVGVVPEPASLVLVGSGLVAAVVRRRRISSRSKWHGIP